MLSCSRRLNCSVQGEEIRLTSDLADDLVARVLALVTAHHDQSPLSPGLAEAEIGSQLPPPEQHLAGLAVQRAVDGRKLIRDGALLAVPGRGAAVDDAAKQRKLMELLEQLEREPSILGASPHLLGVGWLAG